MSRTPLPLRPSRIWVRGRLNEGPLSGTPASCRSNDTRLTAAMPVLVYLGEKCVPMSIQNSGRVVPLRG